MSSRNHSGLTLIEFLIANVLGLMLIGFLCELFIACEQNYKATSEFQTLQANTEIAINILITNLHRTRNVGCNAALNSMTKVSGKEHELTVRYLDFPNNMLLANMSEPTTLLSSRDRRIKAGNILLIADCTSAELFQVATVSTSSNTQKITSLKPLHHLYPLHAEISHVQMNTYFVGKTHKLHHDGTPIYALYQRDINNHQAALVEDINQITLRYSLRHGKLISEVSASEIADWSEVVGLNIHLEARHSKHSQSIDTYISL